MVWEPFALAVIFGLLISAGLYFVVMWPQVAPDDDAPDGAAAPAADAATPADEVAAPAVGPLVPASPAAAGTGGGSTATGSPLCPTPTSSGSYAATCRVGPGSVSRLLRVSPVGPTASTSASPRKPATAAT